MPNDSGIKLCRLCWYGLCSAHSLTAGNWASKESSKLSAAETAECCVKHSARQPPVQCTHSVRNIFCHKPQRRNC